MFSLRVILISSLGLIIICTGITKATKEMETTIKSLAENTILFFERVVKLDDRLYEPKPLKQFKNIKYRHWFRKIKSNQKGIARFIKEFKKLNTYAKEVVDGYLIQINLFILGMAFGTPSDKVEFCDFYRTKILPNLKIEGFGKKVKEVQNLLDELTGELDRIYYTIRNTTSNC